MITNVLQDDLVLSKSERELREGKISVLFRRFAIPGVIGLLFLGIQTIIDGVILGNYVGANALASVSLVLPCYSFMAAMAIVIGVGCQTIVSIRLGEMNRQGANDALVSALLFIIGFSVFMGIVIYTFAPQIAMLLGANDVLLGNSVNYMRAMAPFFPALVILFYSDYVLKALGNPIFSMAVMAGTVLLNIVLDLLFIAQWGMGTTGAGLATGIAFTCGFLVSFPIILREKQKVRLLQGRFSWKLVWQMFYNGSSEGMAELSSGISILLFNLTMMKYLGETGVAAFTALEYILFLCITVFLGISDGIIPIVSYNYGAGNRQRIRQVLKLAVKTNLAIGVALFLVLTFFGEQIVGLFFHSGETQVIKIAAQGTAIYAFAFLFNGLNILASSYFTAIANAKVSIVISLLRGLILVAPAIFFLPMLLGIEGIWLAVPLAEVLTLGVSFVLVRRALSTIEK